MTTVPHWSGREARALREAKRLSVRDFAASINLSHAAVSRWESRGAVARLRRETQLKLDAELVACSDEVRASFEDALREDAAPGRLENNPQPIELRPNGAIPPPQHDQLGNTSPAHRQAADGPAIGMAPLLDALRDLLVASRSRSRLTQQQLAVRIGYSRAAVAGAEALSRIPAESFWNRCDDVLAAGGALRVAYKQLTDSRAASARESRRQVEMEREARINAWRSSADGPGPDNAPSSVAPATNAYFDDSSELELRHQVQRPSLTRREALRCWCGDPVGRDLLNICEKCGFNQRTISALAIVTPPGDNGLGVAIDSLGELIEHYSRALYSMPSVEAYRELIAGRTYAAQMLDGAAAGRRRASLRVSAGWLSNL